MAPRRNYQKELERKLAEFEKEERTPSLLLHACCAPCSSYVLEYLAEYFRITVFYYNPNITDKGEYKKRVSEVKRLIRELPARNPVQFLEGAYDTERYLETVKGLEDAPEGGMRCEKCFRLRLGETAKLCREGGFDYFTTTLTISPLKNAPLLNRIGEETAYEEGVVFLNSDFKKKGGYQRSIELSREYGLYRQDYCGCDFSRKEREKQKRKKTDLDAQ